MEVLKKDGGTAIKYGVFMLTASLIFSIVVRLRSFWSWKLISKLRPPAPPPPPSTKDCPQCCMPVPMKAVKCGHCQSALSLTWRDRPQVLMIFAAYKSVPKFSRPGTVPPREMR